MHLRRDREGGKADVEIAYIKNAPFSRGCVVLFKGCCGYDENERASWLASRGTLGNAIRELTL